MPRRLPMLVALAASLAIVACTNTPAATPLTDPEEILVKSVASLSNIKTVTIKGALAGSYSAPNTGAIDLSTVTFDAALDLPGKKVRLVLDAPSILGTKAEFISADQVSYLKIVGPLAAMLGLDASGKFTQMPAGGGIVPDDATDPTKAIDELRKQLDALPKPPEKLPDERCGDQDCYHVKISLTAEELGEMAEGAAMGSLTLDVWSRKNDLRPAKVGFTTDMGAQGNVSGTFDMTYDQEVNITAPPPDQVAPPG